MGLSASNSLEFPGEVIPEKGPVLSPRQLREALARLPAQSPRLPPVWGTRSCRAGELGSRPRRRGAAGQAPRASAGEDQQAPCPATPPSPALAPPQPPSRWCQGGHSSSGVPPTCDSIRGGAHLLRQGVFPQQAPHACSGPIPGGQDGGHLPRAWSLRDHKEAPWPAPCAGPVPQPSRPAALGTVSEMDHVFLSFLCFRFGCKTPRTLL